MAGKTDYYSNRVLGLLSTDTAAVAISPTFVGLFDNTDGGPDDEYTGAGPNNGNEVTTPTTAGQNSDRQPITDAQWNTAVAATVGDGREISNQANVSWVGWDNGTQSLFHFAIFESGLTASEMLYFGPITPDRTINAGETATFNGDVAGGDLILGED
jgi:hypothetical protein